jgi:hypothetical protein
MLLLSQIYNLKLKPLKLNYKTPNKPNKKIASLQHFLTKLESHPDSEPESEDQTLENYILNHALSNIKHIPKDFLHVLTQITLKNII